MDAARTGVAAGHRRGERGAAGSQEATPLVDALRAYAGGGIARFHMPGHKGGGGVHPRLRELLGCAVFAADVTGVEGLDDLHQPDGVIRAAQDLAARAFGADRSFFLVNGTSAGVQAMLLTVCRPGDPILIPRNIHKSILAGVILSGARPVFMVPEVDPTLGIAMGLDPRRVTEGLRRHPDARGVLILSPTYYGVCGDVEGLVAAGRRAGKPVLVDEAHGPHFHFHEGLPPSAFDAGADACAQGMHKIAAGLTQASILHVREGRLDVPRLEAVLRLIQSTSASYLLLASLDAARMQLATRGRELVERALGLAAWVRDRVNAIPGLYAFGEERLGGPGAVAMDPTKVTVTVKDLGLSGRQVERILRYRYRIQVEMSDLFNVLLIVGFGNSAGEAERVVAALEETAARAGEFREERVVRLLERAAAAEVLPPLPELAVLPRDAFNAASVPVPLEAAAGRIAAEVVTCYPPGIPILCPGERVSRDIVAHLRLVREAGFRVSGPRDPSLATLQVLQ